MTSLSRELLAFAGDYWLTALAVFGRVAGILVLLPGVGGQSVPRRLLAGLAFLLALALAPQLLSVPAVDQTTLARFALSESIAGLLLGIWIRCVLFAVLTAGAMAAHQMGLQLAVGQPIDGENEPPASRFLTLAAIAVFLAADVHLILIGALGDSYRLIPFGSWPLASLIAPDFIEAIGRSFVIALQIAGPFIVAGVVYNLVLGMINRAMPQLMVVLIGAPALSLGMLALFALVLPAMLGGWLDGIARLLPPVFQR